MKNLVFNLAIALVVIAYVGGVFESKKEVKASEYKNAVVLPAANLSFTEEKLSIMTESNKLKHKEVISLDLSASAIGNNPGNIKNKSGIASIRIERVATEDNEISKTEETEVVSSETIESMFPVRDQKTIEEIIAEDNAVTGNGLSNEKITDLGNISIDNIAFNKTGKTIEEIIAEDNAITENNASNEVIALNFK